jgi:hydroxyethylthiazole kinase-like uncharacterized protein yjeF
MPKSPRNSGRASRVSQALLRKWPLPRHSGNDDKNERGSVLVVGGEVAIPGAVILAGIAALRAGAGKLQIATCRSIAPLIGIAVPEALSLGLDETREGRIAPDAAPALDDLLKQTDALLIGPGMKGEQDEQQFVLRVIDRSGSTLVLDAGAIDALGASPDALHKREGRAVITPHSGEMSRMLGVSEEDIARNPEQISIDTASSLNAVVALKGGRTLIASPGGELFCYDSGDVGLATSGSGDTLAGVIAGLIARGTDPVYATLWGVFLHGSAGNKLAKRMGRIGYLARELLDEIPPIMNRL